MKRGFIALALIVLVCLMAGCAQKTGDQPNGGNTGAGSGTGTVKEEKPEKENYRLISNGVLFTIPRNYDLSVDDETKNIYIDDKDLDFNLVMVVRDGSYEESLKDKEGLMANAKQQDVIMHKEITEYTSDGKSYAYFTFEYNDHSSTNTVIYTKATDDKRIGINMMINADRSEEDVIDQINVFLKTAEPTDLADTTQDDLVAQEGLADERQEGKLIDETELTYGKKTIKVSIPDGVYYRDDMDEYVEELFHKQNFRTEDGCDIYLCFYAEEMYDDLNELVDMECIVNDNAKKVKQDGPKTTDHNGNSFLCKTASYLYDGTVFNKGIAACELPDGSMYAVFAENLDGDELSFDDIKGFLDFEIK